MSNSKNKIVAICLAMSMAITGGVIVPNNVLNNSIANAATTTTAVKSPNLVYLSKKSSVQLLSADVVPNEDKEQFVIRLRVYNNESTSLDLLNYWFRLKDKKGKSYTAKLVQPDQSKPVATGSYQDLVFIADVGQKRKADEFNIVCVKWDFSAKNYERTIGTIVIPAGYTKVVAASKTASFPVGTTTLKSLIKSSQRYTEDDTEKYQIIIDLSNTGKWAASLGQETLYYIRTQAGYIYPLKPKDDTMSLLPQQTKSIELNGEIPLSVNLANAVLLIGTKESKTNSLMPYVTYQIPTPGKGSGSSTDDSNAVAFDKSVSFTYEEQDISIRGEQIFRYPDQSQDWFAASFIINNPTQVDLKSPNLEASIALNGVGVSIKPIIVTDGNNLISAKSNQHITVLVPLSYKEKYSTITIELKSKGETTTSTIAKYKTNIPQGMIINKKELNQFWNSYDKSSQLTATQAIAYEGTKTDLVAVELDYKNLESRLGSVKTLKSYLINTAGDIYPANIVLPTKTDLGPNGKGQALIEASLPKNVSLEDLHLIIGEELNAGDQKALYNPVSISIIFTKAQTTGLTTFQLGTNQLSIRHVLAQIHDEKSFQLEFDYDYAEGLESYDWSAGVRNIIVELVDPHGATYEKEISLNSTTGDYLELGKNKSITLSFNDSQFFSKVPTFNGYKLNVYEELDGNKRLIGSKDYEWMIRSSE
ncbi:hypothetical protein [Cohnella yongneupensis]|uniref:Uncharacterized protein n=1 Tax=Cohnella yongneupensis TaxID=425006 RepID=A0ABW0R6U6_9BACL